MKNRHGAKALGGYEWSEVCSDVAHLGGLEPPAYRLGGGCSVH